MDRAAALDLTRPPSEPLTAQHHPELGSHAYDFYRCERCTSLVTQPQMVKGLSDVSTGIQICPCGGLNFRPTNPLWYEFLLPRVLRFAATRLVEKLRGLR